MHTLIIPDTSGHTTITFDPTDTSTEGLAAVKEAERIFDEQRAKGRIAADSEANVVLETFDPTVKETIFIPQMAGG